MQVLNLAIAGAASKITFLYGAVKCLYVGFKMKPANISGISSGALVTLFAALERFDLEDVLINATAKDIFKVSPMNKNGKLSARAIGRILTGKRSLGDQSNLKKTLKKHITEEEFEAYKLDLNSPNAFIGAVNYDTGAIKYFNLKELDFNKAIDVVSASASIPGVAEGEVIDGDLYYDGGVVDYIGSSWLANNATCDHLISVYSRPEKYPVKHKEMKGIISVIARTIGLLTKNVSIDDEVLTDSVCQLANIKHTKVFTQHPLMAETFKFDKDLNRAMFQLGIEAMEDALKDSNMLNSKLN